MKKKKPTKRQQMREVLLEIKRDNAKLINLSQNYMTIEQSIVVASKMSTRHHHLLAPFRN